MRSSFLWSWRWFCGAALVWTTGAASHAALAEPEPPPQLSGMDLLYSDRVSFAANGEPLVTIGLMTGQKTLTVHADVAVQVDFWEAGVLKQSRLPAGSTVTAVVARSEAARRRFYVDVDGVSFAERERLSTVLAGWRARGYRDVEGVEEGTLMGIGGRVLDNRQIRIALPAATEAAARRLATEVYQRFGSRALASARLVERPWGELTITSSQGPLGTATSFARLVPLPAPGQDGRLTLRAVEHSRGYAWHGFEDRGYRGDLYMAIDPEGALSAVNVLGAEEVLKGVVPSELFASAPLEALKAQAVAARNHLLAQLGLRHHGDPFHLCAEQHCQVYGGISREHPQASRAVEITAGEAMFRQGKLVHAVYSSSCGGHTEDNDAVWGDDPDPALRGRPDFDAAEPGAAAFARGIDQANLRPWLDAPPQAWCARASFARPEKFRWKKRFAAAEITALVRAAYPGIGSLHDLAVLERGPGGRVISLELLGDEDRAVVLLELPIRRLFGNLNSGTFSLHTERDAGGTLTAVTFNGGGWGHGVGMCQMGAIGRAEAGVSYRDILAHYYSGAAPEALYGARAALASAK